MHWSALLIVTAGLNAPQTGALPQSYESYTKAYHAAQSATRPMLVVINPGDSTAESAVTL
jgi:hypothetical protein